MDDQKRIDCDAIHQMAPVFKRIDSAVWIAYRNAGSPYGDTSEGRSRWVEEQGAQNQRRWEERARSMPLRMPTR